MSNKKVKRIVVHPNFHQKVDGKLRRIPVGTEVEVTEERAKRAGTKLADPKSGKVLAGGKLVDAGAKGDSKKEAELTAQLSDALAKNAALEKQVAELQKAAKK